MHTHIDLPTGWYCESCCPQCNHICKCDTGCDGTCMGECLIKKPIVTACGKTEMCGDCKARGGCGDECGPWTGDLDGESN